MTKGNEYMIANTSWDIAFKHIACVINSNKDGFEIKTFDFPKTKRRRRTFVHQNRRLPDLAAIWILQR